MTCSDEVKSTPVLKYPVGEIHCKEPVAITFDVTSVDTFSELRVKVLESERLFA